MSLLKLLDNQQIKVNEIFNTYDSKHYGKIRAPRPAPIYSETPLYAGNLAPLLGENSIEILKELKYSESEIDNLLKDKVTSN